MFLGRSVDRDVPDEEVFADADDINSFNVAAGPADRGSDLSQFPGHVMNPDSKGQAVAGIRCRFIGHSKRLTFSTFIGKSGGGAICTGNVNANCLTSVVPLRLKTLIRVNPELTKTCTLMRADGPTSRKSDSTNS